MWMRKSSSKCPQPRLDASKGRFTLTGWGIRLIIVSSICSEGEESYLSATFGEMSAPEHTDEDYEYDEEEE